MKLHYLKKLHFKDAFMNFPFLLYQQDNQGWGGNHPYLKDGITNLNKSQIVIVEVGVWKGGSVIPMALELKKNNLSGIIIAVDTFLGSVEHYINPDWSPSLVTNHGYPHYFYTFLSNVMHAEVQDYVIPCPLDSRNAFLLLGFRGIQIDILHIDAGHDYESVNSDISQWYKLLTPGGLIICDDYRDDDGWPGVKKAVDEFVIANCCLNFESSNNKARFNKPIY